MSPSPVVLLVDDETVILDILAEPMEEAGFGLARAASGEEAVAKLEAEPGAYRALVTDVNLGRGKLTGWDVAKRARELAEELPVVYVTGGAAHDWPSHGVPKSVLITKPFAPAQIITAVSALLNKGSSQLPI